MMDDLMPGGAQPTPANLECSVINDLLHLPAEIQRLQADFDTAELVYRQVASEEILTALEEKTFMGKDGESRAAANEQERSAAIEYALTHLLNPFDAKKNRDAALRLLQEAKNRFEAVQLVARLIAKGK